MNDEIIPARPVGPRERDRRIMVTARSEIRALTEALDTLPELINAELRGLRTLIRCWDRRRDLADSPGAIGLRGVARGAVALSSTLLEITTGLQALADELIARADDADRNPPDQRRLPPPEPPVRPG